MSKSSGTFRISCISNGKTFSSHLLCDQGDINQFYDSAGSVTPAFNGNNSPKLMYFCYDSDDNAVPAVIPDDNIVWYANGVKLVFVDNISTNNFNGETGHFMKTTTTFSYNNGETKISIKTLKVVKDIVNVNGKQSFMISASAVIPVDNTSITTSAVFPVTVGKGEVNSKKVRIQSPSSYKGTPFTITEKGGSCKLEAVVITDSVATGGNYTYEWAQQVDGAWKALTGDTGNPSILTVTEAMVDGSALFKCTVKKDGNVYGMDVQNVNDISDPYQIIPNCVTVTKGENGKVSKVTPAVAVSYKGDGVSIYHKPYVKCGDNVVAESKYTYKVTLSDSIGTLLNGKDDTTHDAPFNNEKEFKGGDIFEIPEKFITANSGVEGQIDADIQS